MVRAGGHVAASPTCDRLAEQTFGSHKRIDMDPVPVLSHVDQLTNYLKWCHRKRDAAVAEVVAEFNVIKESRLFVRSHLSWLFVPDEPSQKTFWIIP